MNIFHILSLGVGLFCGASKNASAEPSARKIAPLKVGFVGSSDLKTSCDGRFLAMLSVPGEKGSDCIVFERCTHKTRRLPGSSRMEPLCFSRDGRGLWVWGLHLDELLPGLNLKPRDFPFLALYDLRRRRYVRAFLSASEEAEVPSDGTLSRDGRTLIYASQDGFICGFNTRSGKVIWRRRAQNKSDEPASIELNSTGSQFLRTSDDDNLEAQSAEVVSTRSGHILSTLRLPSAPRGGVQSAFSDAKFAPRGSQVAVFQSDTQQWVFFDSRTAKVQWKMGGPSRISEGDLTWQWSPDARFVGVSGPKGFELRDARTGQILEVCAAPKDAVPTFSPDGSRIYALMDNDTGFGAATVL